MGNEESDKVSHENWIHLVGAGDEELLKYTNEFQLPARYLSGVNDEFEIARAEMRDNLLVMLQFMVIKEGVGGLDEYRTRPLSMIHTDNRIITALSESPERLTAFFSQLKNEPYLIYEHIVLYVFNEIQQEIVAGLRRIHHDIDHMQTDIQKSSKNKELNRLIVIDKSLTAFQTAIQNNRKVLQKIYESDRFNQSEELTHIMHEVLIESNQAESMVDEGVRVIDLLNDVYENVISNNLNNIMKVLTSITIVLTMPSLIIGFYSMAVHVPGKEHPVSYVYILIAAVLVSLVTMIFLRKRNYL